jgi:hypothetical protein
VCILAFVCVLAALSLPTHAHAASGSSDQAIVTAGLLTINDFPPGWTQSPPSSSGDTDISGAGKSCAALKKKVDAVKKLRTAHEKSPNFKQGSFDQVSNSPSVYRTTAAATAEVKILTNSAVVPCLQKYVQGQLAKQATHGLTFKLSIGRVSVPKVGDNTVGFQFAVTASQKGQSFRVYLDLQVVQVGRTLLAFSFEGAGSAPMLAYQQLVQTVVARVQAVEA